MPAFDATNSDDCALSQFAARASVQRYIGGDVDTVGADAFGALGIVLDEEGDLMRTRELA
jgi:hypothetical protein